eukprot:TRINITY_DN31348_c0_g1_i1.p1 TRINITY_DN31348_c0_g1~~TRINITY_DN31348_c0_g1_i1.p1  ORF type:complete len:290 (-),score=28.37 TRINITY_DN31348_c0_g1_i1:455-1324(-)
MGSEDDEFRKVSLTSRCEWHPETVSRLLDSYGEKCSRGKGYLKTKDWEDIVSYVNIQLEGAKTAKTMKQCREKVDSLKRRYKLERRKAELRGSANVEWTFYGKLDEIMRCVRRSANGTVSDLELVDPLEFDDSFGDSQNNNRSFLGNGSSKALEGISYDEKGKGLLETNDGLCDVVLNSVGYENGMEFIEPQSFKRKRNSKNERNSKNQRNENKGVEEADPLQALANAVAGFSELYSRIEIAKIELFSKMHMELAKLRKWRRKEEEDSGCCSVSASSDSCSSDPEQEYT